MKMKCGMGKEKIGNIKNPIYLFLNVLEDGVREETSLGKVFPSFPVPLVPPYENIF